MFLYPHLCLDIATAPTSKGVYSKRKKKSEREKTKIVLKEIEKPSGKTLYPIKSSGLLEKVYPPQV